MGQIHECVRLDEVGIGTAQDERGIIGNMHILQGGHKQANGLPAECRTAQEYFKLWSCEEDGLFSCGEIGYPLVFEYRPLQQAQAHLVGRGACRTRARSLQS